MSKKQSRAEDIKAIEKTPLPPNQKKALERQPEDRPSTCQKMGVDKRGQDPTVHAPTPVFDVSLNVGATPVLLVRTLESRKRKINFEK